MNNSAYRPQWIVRDYFTQVRRNPLPEVLYHWLDKLTMPLRKNNNPLNFHLKVIFSIMKVVVKVKQVF